MNNPYDRLKQAFAEAFGPGGRLHVVRAPGRVNLIGEHTDYNDGYVFPMAIEPEMRFVCRSRTDGIVRVGSTLFAGQFVEFSLQKPIERADPKWANYVRGVAAQLIQAGIPLVGMDVLIDNTVPMGGGLSSSAALEVGTAICLLTLAGTELDRGRLALLCQKAEHEYALMPCGIMDQMIVASAQEGHVTLYDCRSGDRHYVPIDSRELRIAIINSMVHHELSDGEYAKRRKECEAGVAAFQAIDPKVRSLRDVTLAQLEAARETLDPVVYRRCRHVITETERTATAARQLSQRHYEEFGELMKQSHASLRDDYQVSCKELDILVREALTVKGVYGARMTGGGFGGCIVAAVQPRAVDALKDYITAAYQQATGKTPAIYVTTATAAASVIE